MNISKISNTSFSGKLRLGGFSYIEKNDSLGLSSITNFNQHKDLVENHILPDSKVNKPKFTTNKYNKKGFFKGDFVVDTKDIKEIDEDKITIQKPQSVYSAYIYYSHPGYGITSYNHILNAYIAASLNDNVTIHVQNDNRPWEA